MIANINHFDYDKSKMEWFILDSKDGPEDVRLFSTEEEIKIVQRLIHPVKLKYLYRPVKMTIAQKRNYLTKNMTNPWFANVDSDDVYMETYLKYCIDQCKINNVQLAGSPEMIFIHPHHEYKISAIKCSAARQIHEGTFVGTKKYWRSMNGYARHDKKGEGASMVDGNERKIVQTECKNCMICVSHNTNTCSKEMFLEANVQEGKISGLKADILKDILKEEVEGGRNDMCEFKNPEGGLH
jgi:hypothetical protein